MSRPIFVMPMVLQMTLLHSLGHNNKNEVKHDFLSLVKPLIPALLSWINGTIFYYVKTKETRCDVTLLVMWCCWHQCAHHVSLTALSMPSFCLLSQDNWNNVQHYFFGDVIPVLVSHDTNGIIINTNIAFVSSRWSKWDATWLFQFDT